MPKGGRRNGAGRKPGAAWSGKGVVLGLNGERRTQGPRLKEELPPALSVEAKEGLLAAPYWLPEGAKGYWERWAPEAFAVRILTPATAAGFTELCQRADFVGKIAAKISLLGPDTQDALPYLGLYDRMSQKLETSLVRFGLTGLGKPATSEKPAAQVNPFAALAAK